jgi:antitoxin Phd
MRDLHMATPRGTIRDEDRATGAWKGRWKLEDAKARFSEVVRHAQAEGPQRVSVRGRDTVVILSVEDFDRLARQEPRQPLVAFMESLHLDGLDLTRDDDSGRDIEL